MKWKKIQTRMGDI